jgi:hypothetical protein
MSQMIQLVIKSFGSKEADFKLQFELNKTVADLKQLLAEAYPGNPSTSSQRLIFAGRLLQDGDVMNDVLKLVTSVLLSLLTTLSMIKTLLRSFISK